LEPAKETEINIRAMGKRVVGIVLDSTKIIFRV